MKPVIALTILVSLFACATLPKRENHSLDAVEKLTINHTTREMAKDIVGDPDRVIQTSDGEEGWIYYDPELRGQRMSLTFNSKKNLLTGKLWIISESEPEANLDVVFSRFPSVKFQKTKVESEIPHVVLFNQFLYIDYNSGISFTYDEKRKMVDTISWGIPGAKPPRGVRNPAVKSL